MMRGLLLTNLLIIGISFKKKLDYHKNRVYHKRCLGECYTIQSTLENVSFRVDSQLSKEPADRIQSNVRILKCIMKAVIYCGKQCLPLCAMLENLDKHGNIGNFLSLLKLMEDSNSELQQHLLSSKLKNARYISAKVLNEIISVLGKGNLQASIIKEIMVAIYFAVLADAINSHHTDQLSLVLRFVDKNYEIREKFVAFVKLERVRAKDIFIKIKQTLHDLHLNIENTRGQGYDGATSMACLLSGVKAKFLNIQPKAIYTHYACHRLNLVISHS